MRRSSLCLHIFFFGAIGSRDGASLATAHCKTAILLAPSCLGAMADAFSSSTMR